MKRRNGHDGRPPAWPKYARDWLTSEAVLAMPRAARSLYDDLLSYQWLNGSLPADIPTLARMTGETVESFTELWKHVEPQFDRGDDGRLRNGRQQLEWESLAELRDARSEAGRRGAAVSNGKRPATPPANGQHGDDPLLHQLPPANERPSASTAVSSSEGTDTPSRSTRAREEDPGPGPKNEFQALVDWWDLRYAEVTKCSDMPLGARYSWGPDQQAKASALLRRARENGRGIDLVRDVCERFIAHPTFGKEPPTFGRILANWNTLVASSAPSKPAAPNDGGAVRRAREHEERQVRRAWEDRHMVQRDVPKHGGGTRKAWVLDGEWPGHEAAKKWLDENPQSKRPGTDGAA